MSHHLFGAGAAAHRDNPYLSDSAARYTASDHLSAASYAGATGYGAAGYGQRENPYLSGSGLYGSSLYGGSDRYGIGSGAGASGTYGGYGGVAPSAYSQKPWEGVGFGVDTLSDGKRSAAEALYNQNVLGSNTIGQTEGLYSTNSLVKRARYELASNVPTYPELTSNLPTYPQRPGEKDCSHYMLTRTCRFGESCKFDHPVWVPEGGLPDWKEVPLVPSSESLPERPGEPDCPFYMKTHNCKYGFRCKFNHPKDKQTISSAGVAIGPIDKAELPERPSEPICSFYAKTGTCKFGSTCKFHHPKDIQIPSSEQDSGSVQPAAAGVNGIDSAGGSLNPTVPTKPFIPFTPALLHNSKGLPIRPGETDCPFYLKTGSCKYGATCRFNHPERPIISPVVAPFGNSIMPHTPANLPVGGFGTTASILPNVDPRLGQASLGVTTNIYPQRPGQTECDYYMKSGHCSFGERCKFHHPMNRSTATAVTKQGLSQNVKLTLAGLPRREGSVACPYYMKTGICKYGATCRYDHPPPGEAVALATVQGVTMTAEGEDEEEGDEEEGDEEEEENEDTEPAPEQ